MRCSSNLTFALEPGWAFVETEDWRPDLVGSWVAPGMVDTSEWLPRTITGRMLADWMADGWVYNNDAWLDPHSAPLDEWRATGMTRRRRWTRRIYHRDDTEPLKSV